MIDPGQMRTKLWYQTATLVRDLNGHNAKVWTDQFPVFARLRPLRGAEPVQGAQVVATNAYEVTTRYRPEIQTTGRLRIHDSGRVLSIESVIDWEFRRVELTITAHERTPASA